MKIIIPKLLVLAIPCRNGPNRRKQKLIKAISKIIFELNDFIRMKNHELNNLLIELDEINVQLKPLFDKYINGKNKLIRDNAEQSLKMLIRRAEILINSNHEAYNLQIGGFGGNDYRITEYLNDFYLITVFPTRFPEFLQLLNAYNNSN